jgi:hypothetical protein
MTSSPTQSEWGLWYMIWHERTCKMYGPIFWLTYLSDNNMKLWCISIVYQLVLIHQVPQNHSIKSYNTGKHINQHTNHTIILINTIQVKWVRKFLFQWWNPQVGHTPAPSFRQIVN